MFLVCTRFKRWVEESIEKPVVRWLERQERRCERFRRWVEERVEKPIDEWVQRTERRCSQRPWWHPLRWICWLVTTLVKVTRWVIVTVGKWVIYTVCRLVTVLVRVIVWVVVTILKWVSYLVCVLVRLIPYLLSNLWTLPNTLIGLLIGFLLTWCIPTFDTKRWYWKFCCGRGISGFIHRKGPRATTIGYVAIFWDSTACQEEAVLEHELVHVHQYNLLGPLFLLIYLPLVPFFGSGRNHPLERPGYQREDEVRSGS